MSKRKKLDLETLERRALSLRDRYHALEEAHHGSRWSVEEDALAFLTDAALVGRLTMAQQKRWPAAGKTGELEHKLAESMWWLVVLAHRMDVDLEQALETFLSTTERRLGGAK